MTTKEREIRARAIENCMGKCVTLWNRQLRRGDGGDLSNGYLAGAEDCYDAIRDLQLKPPLPKPKKAKP